jgi:hypothetical protein
VVQDVMNNTGTNAGLGEEKGSLEIRDLIGKGVIKDLNSLLEHELEENFRAVTMELDYTVSSRAIVAEERARLGQLIIPSAFLGFVQAATVLRLAATGEGEKPRDIHLIARPQFVLGRSRQTADFITWFWPRTSENDEATRHLGKAHVVAEASEGNITLRDNGSPNGTLFDLQKLPTENGACLKEKGMLRLGQDYELEVWHQAGAFAGEPPVANARLWRGPAATRAPAAGSVRFAPRSCGLALWDAIWLFTDATFGLSRSNPVVIDLPGLAEIQGRFHHWRGSFWIENSSQDSSFVINGITVLCGQIVPLTTGQTIRLAGQEYRVEASV